MADAWLLAKETLGLGFIIENFASAVETVMGNALLMLLAATCLVPIIILLSLFFLTVAVRTYIHRNHQLGLSSQPQDSGIWAQARTFIASIGNAQGLFYHGFDVSSLNNLPAAGPSGGALLVLYHGAFPLDFYFLWARVQLVKKRTMWMVGDRFLWKLPGVGPLLDALHVVQGSPEECVKLLKAGHLVVIAPGGLREAQFSDSMYKLIWGKRTGFARVAQEAGVPIIPVFCRNIRQCVHTFPWKAGLLRAIYEKIRFPLVPVYGPWPVKLRCFIGKPLSSQSEETVEHYAYRVRTALEELIEEHQPLHSTFQAICERWTLAPVADDPVS